MQDISPAQDVTNVLVRVGHSLHFHHAGSAAHQCGHPRQQDRGEQICIAVCDCNKRFRRCGAEFFEDGVNDGGITFDGGEPVSTGVGLANIRERLEQAYGDKHLFETMEPTEGGFAVIIELPLEISAPVAAASDLTQAAAAAE